MKKLSLVLALILLLSFTVPALAQEGDQPNPEKLRLIEDGGASIEAANVTEIGKRSSSHV